MAFRFHRRVNVRWVQQWDEKDPAEHGDIIAPEPDIAGALVSALLMDDTVSEITITAENSITGDDAEAD